MAFCVQGNYTIQDCLSIGTETLGNKLLIQGTSTAPYLLNVGYTSNGKIITRHIDGKASNADALDNLYIQYDVNCNTILNGGTSTGKVGINTTSPNTPLQIRDNTIAAGGAGLSVFGYDGAVEFTTTRAESPANAAIYLYNRPTSGTNGTGTGISFRASSTNTADRNQGGIFTSWTDSTDATRTAKFIFDLVCGGTSATRMTLLGNGNLGIGTTSPSYNLVVGNDLGNLSTLSTTSVVGNTSANSFFVIGQSATRNLQFNWQYNATAGSACGQIVTYGYSNPISIDGSRLVLQSLSGGKVGIGTATGNGQLTVAVDQSSNNQHINIVGTQTSYSQDYSLGIPTSTKDFRIYDATAGATRFTLTSTGNVGIGTTSPGYKLTISDTASTKLSLCGGTTQNGITFEKAGSGCAYYIFNGDYADLCGFGIYNVNTAALPMFINNSSNVGINTSSPSYRLHVNGTFYAAGSSIKYKEGICNYDTDSCLFMCLKPVAYQYKDEFKHLGKELKADTQIGLIAEDVAEVMPELAVLVNEEDEKVVRNVDYEKLSIVLLSELQKLRKEVDELKNNK